MFKPWKIAKRAQYVPRAICLKRSPLQPSLPNQNMLHRPSVKALEAAASGKRKRRRDDVEPEPDSEQPFKWPRRGLLRLRRGLPPRPFPFLNLPPELRNRVYELAFDITYRAFPTSSFRKEYQLRLFSEVRLSTKTPPPIPYLGLVQSCRQIRKEFHSWWMNAHRIPLCNTNKYLRTFFPPRPKSDTAYYASKGNVRIYLRRIEMPHRDLLPVIKHMLRFPQRTMEVEQVASISDPLFDGLTQLLGNKHPMWLRWIRTNVLSQVRLAPRDSPPHGLQHRIILVVKEKHATPWMKTVFGAPSGADRDEDAFGNFLASIGLNNVIGWRIDFAVDYR
ncbi:uncharacterized protein CC84DRAFT_1177789 [Paraphaeosphaeria sporulosa]|uniref:F-box domain-containing protein n=1 Tax=Paraphaeosphaeria sporulosa TaxID=1460663 RepID=A0A177CAY4_9PLEO|nr:uncharacterized protein CC84DRAFT_1177789 [Paraphaeosphaeria sporulosa]OAG03850.1 hypothetical protein CC84DRAFT_1177789 [Paraphaeosphaeria sporulosa]